MALRYTSHHLDRFISGSSSDHSSSNHSSADHSPADHTLGHSTSDQSSSRHSSPSLPLGMRPRSPATIVPSSIPALGALVPTRADLLPPHKRFRDSISPEDSVEEDIEADVLADIKADATAVEVDFEVDIEDEDEGEAESSNRGTIEVGVDVVAGIDIPDEDIKSGQRELEARSLIAGGERAGLLDRVATLERSNTRLRGTLRSASARFDRFRHRMSFMAGELRKIRRFRYYDKLRFRRLETFIMTITRSGMTPEAIEELINQRVAEALAAYKANHTDGLVVENGNRGGIGNGNPNRNDRGAMPVARECTYHDFVKCQQLNFKGTEGVVGLTRWFEKIETIFHISNCPKRYQVKYATCTLLNSALTWWNSHKRTIGVDVAFSMSWRELMKLTTEVYCPRNEIQKMETELWNLTMKGNDLAAYTQRFQELIMLCTKMVPEEEDRVERFIGGLLNNIQGNVIVAEPMKLQDAIRIANNLMDHKLKGYDVRNAKNKRRLNNNQKDNRVQQPPYKRQNFGGQSVARAYTAGNNERRGYAGPLPYCNKCKLHHEGPCTVKCGKCNKVGHMARDCINAVATTATHRALVVNQRVRTCFECGSQLHFKKDYLKLKNQNHGNKAGNKTNKARGKAYVLGGGEANPDSNVVTGMFLLNNHYASMLFDSSADRSFVSSTFSDLLDVIPSTLDVSYVVELADGRIA
ncbi:reverse transcriptase domain-containing protein [Tanacetum coccineum]